MYNDDNKNVLWSNNLTISFYCVICTDPRYNSYTFFSLAHESKALLGIEQPEPHHPVQDAIISLRLYALYKSVEHDMTQLSQYHQQLLALPVEASFAKNNPSYDGVCMGNKKTCNCGQPFFF